MNRGSRAQRGRPAPRGKRKGVMVKALKHKAKKKSIAASDDTGISGASEAELQIDEQLKEGYSGSLEETQKKITKADIEKAGDAAKTFTMKRKKTSARPAGVQGRKAGATTSKPSVRAKKPAGKDAVKKGTTSPASKLAARKATERKGGTKLVATSEKDQKKKRETGVVPIPRVSAPTSKTGKTEASSPAKTTQVKTTPVKKDVQETTAKGKQAVPSLAMESKPQPQKAITITKAETKATKQTVTKQSVVPVKDKVGTVVKKPTKPEVASGPAPAKEESTKEPSVPSATLPASTTASETGPIR
ncbi:uncharacterized protein LOC135367603 [Ornithodoros turicata]|uniref:uncharacterized protein LOC135367603 n=1 Tax=Ornithodoros turicata TaxID=34597 RepID=UPI003138A8B0